MEMIKYNVNFMVVATMYPASRIVVKPIKCEFTSILDNIVLLKILRYNCYRCSVILEHHYLYAKGI